MGRASIKENKNIYQLCREDLHFTRAQASEEMQEMVSDSRIEKIESGRVTPYPEEILTMSEAYRRPDLTNYYCTHECAIGRKLIPEVETKTLSQIVLEVLNALNALDRERDRLIAISADGIIDETELDDFKGIRDELRSLSASASSLQLWIDNEIIRGALNREKL